MDERTRLRMQAWPFRATRWYRHFLFCLIYTFFIIERAIPLENLSKLRCRKQNGYSACLCVEIRIFIGHFHYLFT